MKTFTFTSWTKTRIVVLAGACALLAGAATEALFYLYAKIPVQGIPKGWSVLDGDVDQWDSADGKIQAHSTTGETILASTREYRNFTLAARVSSTNREASLAFRMQDGDNGYLVLFGPPGTPCPWNESGFIALVRKTGGQEITLKSYQGRVFSALHPSSRIAVNAQGPRLTVRLNDVTVFRVTDTNYHSGFIGLRIFGTGDYPCDATFSEITFP